MAKLGQWPLLDWKKPFLLCSKKPGIKLLICMSSHKNAGPAISRFDDTGRKFDTSELRFQLPQCHGLSNSDLCPIRHSS